MAKTLDSCRDSHVAILAFPFGTHAAPLLAITRRLATASPTTVFSFFGTAKSNSSLFSGDDDGADRLENVRFHDVADGVPEGYVLTGRPQEAIELFLQAAPENFRREIAAAELKIGKKVKCMITDGFFWFAKDMAEEMKATWIAFWTGGPNSLSAHLYTDLLRETIGVKDVDERKEETLGFIPGMDKIRVKDTPEGVVFGNLKSIFSNMLHQMGHALPHASAVFLNSFEELDPTLTNNLKSKFKRYLNIGPLALATSATKTVHDVHGCLAWLEKQASGSVAYISFGTVMTPPPGELVAIAEGLEVSKVPFIWSLKNLVHLPEGFLERTKEQGIVVPWAPQVELLKHEATGVFVTHCGWNSVLESVAGGVPMICRPYFGDQSLNGRAVEVVWETGMTITNGVFTKDGFKQCLEKVLVLEDGKKMKANAKKLKEQAHEAVSIDGSSHKNMEALIDLAVSM